MRIKEFVKRKIYGNRYNSETFISYLKRSGISIGENTVFFGPQTTIVDIQNPHLLTIGNNVKITANVTILTHDYSWSVGACFDGNCIGAVSPVTIGNNVFIGMNTIILRGTVIEDNVIIGAGSVVHGVLEKNSVYAGNPVKKICTLEDYIEKHRQKCISEAKNIVKIYYRKFHKRPGIQELREYQFLFTKELNSDVEILMRDTGEYELCKKYLLSHEPTFSSLDQLIDESLSEDI